MKKIISVAASLFWFAAANAASSINDFLREAAAETAVGSLPAADRPGGLNRWLEEAQLRVSDDPDKHSVGLRVQPKMPSQISAENSILGLRRQQRELSQESDLNDRLMLRYTQWLDLIEQSGRVGALDRARALADAKVSYHRSLAQTDDFQPDALLEAELDLAQFQEQDRMQREHLAALRATVDIDPSPDALVPIDEMLNVLALAPEAASGIDKREGSLALELAKEQARNERAQQGLALDLVQVAVDTDTRSNRDTVGLLVGVRLPLGGDNYNSVRRAYDLIEATSELERRIASEQRSVASRRELIGWQKTEADAIGGTLAALDERLERNRQSGDVAVLLTLQEQQMKARERLAEARQRALRYYLDYLHVTGQLAQQPLRNWLTSGQPPL